jgi:hypothetical protein
VDEVAPKSYRSAKITDQKSESEHSKGSSRVQEPSDAFINRLERQTGLLHPSQEDINIEEHSSSSQKLPMESSIDDYNENSFKNQIVQIKDLNTMFAKE